MLLERGVLYVGIFKMHTGPQHNLMFNLVTLHSFSSTTEGGGQGTPSGWGGACGWVGHPLRMVGGEVRV